MVIGGGPGGYVAAIKAAQLGLKVITSWNIIPAVLTNLFHRLLVLRSAEVSGAPV